MGDLQKSRKGHDRCRSNRRGHGNDDAWPDGRYLQGVDTDFQSLSWAISVTARILSNQLYSDAERNENIIILITLAGFLISTFVASAGRSVIVRPIESITDVMQRLSAGETNVEIGYRDRRDEIGRMVDAIDVFRKNIIERHAMEQTLTEAIEAISEGFSLYDADDKLSSATRTTRKCLLPTPM